MYSKLLPVMIFLGASLASSSVFAQPSPEAVFATYVKAVEAGDAAAIPPLIADDATKPPFFACPDGQNGRECLITYIISTVVSRHTQFKILETKVDEGVVSATLEVKNDLTRAAGVERFRGVDRIAVKDGKIVDFAFFRDETDPQTVKFFDFVMKSMRPK